IARIPRRDVVERAGAAAGRRARFARTARRAAFPDVAGEGVTERALSKTAVARTLCAPYGDGGVHDTLGNPRPRAHQLQLLVWLSLPVQRVAQQRLLRGDRRHRD